METVPIELLLSLSIFDNFLRGVALRLEKEFGILCRPGLHCSPAAHRTIGTFPEGTVRFGLSFFNTEEEIEEAIQAVCRFQHNEDKCAFEKDQVRWKSFTTAYPASRQAGPSVYFKKR